MSVDVNQTKRFTRDDAHNSIEPYTSTDLNELFMLGINMLPLRFMCTANTHRRPYAQCSIVLRMRNDDNNTNTSSSSSDSGDGKRAVWIVQTNYRRKKNMNIGILIQILNLLSHTFAFIVYVTYKQIRAFCRTLLL